MYRPFLLCSRINGASRVIDFHQGFRLGGDAKAKALIQIAGVDVGQHEAAQAL
jgi:hypothetical protein